MASVPNPPSSDCPQTPRSPTESFTRIDVQHLSILVDSCNRRGFRIIAAGNTMVVGVDHMAMPRPINTPRLRDDLSSLATRCQSRVLAFDLTGIDTVPLGFIDLLGSLACLGFVVHVLNPSRAVRDVLSQSHHGAVVSILFVGP